MIVTVKTPALESVAARIGPLIGPETMVLSAMNGVPWWFFDRFGGACQGTRLASIDPNGSCRRRDPDAQRDRLRGHMSCSVPEPGLVLHKAGKRLIIGEPDGKQTRATG